MTSTLKRTRSCAGGKSPARGRPPDPAKDSAIAEAARSLFLEKGYGASLDDIATRAGVSKQTVYARFKSKEDLFAAIIRTTADEMLRPLLSEDAQKTPRETLIALGEQYLQTIFQPRRLALQRLLIAQSAMFPALAKRYYEAGPSYVYEKLAGYLARGTRAGRLAVENPAIAAEQFLGMVKGLDHVGALLGLEAAKAEPARRRRVEESVDAFLKIYG